MDTRAPRGRIVFRRIKKITDLYRAISVAKGGAHEIIGKISAR